MGARLDLTCIFGKEVVTFRFVAANEGIAESVAEVLGRNMGRNLRELGLLKVAEDPTESKYLLRGILREGRFETSWLLLQESTDCAVKSLRLFNPREMTALIDKKEL